MEESNKIVLFQGRHVRRVWHNGAWWFVLEDIVLVLTDSSDPKQYIQKMKQRDEPLAEGWVQLVLTLEVDTAGGTQRMNCVNTEGAFRIIQSIPSPKAEPSLPSPPHPSPTPRRPVCSPLFEILKHNARREEFPTDHYSPLRSQLFSCKTI